MERMRARFMRHVPVQIEPTSPLGLAGRYYKMLRDRTDARPDRPGPAPGGSSTQRTPVHHIVRDGASFHRQLENSDQPALKLDAGRQPATAFFWCQHSSIVRRPSYRSYPTNGCALRDARHRTPSIPALPLLSFLPIRLVELHDTGIRC